ncbi:unnamed protein product [Rhizophagus irregularis]|nr:unnamed protein product [Rhizophagus irregularis]CAB5354349.1 unnamed protein product [Rhizophagus irregularis]
MRDVLNQRIILHLRDGILDNKDLASFGAFGRRTEFSNSCNLAGSSCIIDDDIDKERILDPIIKCSNELKSEFRTQIIKLYYYLDEDDWNRKENS